ncbi:MAG: RNA-binding protein [Ardenticatenaceae bacterium]|nr:RNA-binding protein [Ardenticatenaceae bacterium]
MSTKLYVGNLSYHTTESELRDLFATVGEVQSATVVTDRDTGRSRGFGFIEMASEQAAREAIRQLNGKTVDDREIQVNEARPREDRGPRREGGGGSRRGGAAGAGGTGKDAAGAAENRDHSPHRLVATGPCPASRLTTGAPGYGDQGRFGVGGTAFRSRSLPLT